MQGGYLVILEKPKNKNGRPHAEFNLEKFYDLYEKGYTDKAIADHLSISKSTVVNIRKTRKLKPNRERGERGVGKPNGNKSYYLEVRRLMGHQKIAQKIWAATKEIMNGSEEYAATVIDPYPGIPQFLPGLASQKPEEAYINTIDFLINSNRLLESSVTAGVPGLEIFNLAEIIDTEDEDKKSEYALKAALGAGYVNIDAKLHEARIIPANRRNEIWDNHKDQLINFLKIKERRRPKLTTYKPQMWAKTGNGKKGNGGGYQNYDNAVNFTGISRS